MEGKKDFIQKKSPITKSGIRIQSVMLDKNIFTTPEEATSYVSQRLKMEVDRFDQIGDFFTFGQLSKARFEEPLQEFSLGKGITALVGRIHESNEDASTDFDKLQDLGKLEEGFPSDEQLRKIERVSEKHSSIMQAIAEHNEKLAGYLTELGSLTSQVEKMRSSRKLSYEYLTSVLEKAKAHLPEDLFKEIHRFSRAYAGGKLRLKEDLEKAEPITSDVALALAALGSVEVQTEEKSSEVEPEEEPDNRPPGGDISKSTTTEEKPVEIVDVAKAAPLVQEEIWKWGAEKIPLIFEPNLSGQRVLLNKSQNSVEIKVIDSKEGKESTFDSLKEILKTIDQDFTLDGIIMKSVQDEKPKLALIDLKSLGRDLTKEPLSKRRGILKNFYSAYLLGKSCFSLVEAKEVNTEKESDDAMEWASLQAGSQGVVAKSSLSPYETDPDWISLKCEAPAPTIEVPIQKIDEDKRYVFGVVLEPDSVDAQGDVISSEQIQKSAYEFMRDSRTVGLNHEKKIDSVVIHNEIVQDESAQRFGAPVKKGSWFMGVFVGDEGVWEQVKGGGLNSFSIGGVGIRSPLKANVPA